VATRRFIGVLGCKQPRAVGAGKRGLGRPARHNASAATGAARGCPVRLATDSDRQSGRAGYRLEGRGGRRRVMRVVPVPSPGHRDGGRLPGPSPRPALPCDGLLARSVSPVFAPGLLTGWPDPALLTTSLSLTGACNDNDPTVLQARSSARGARPGRLVWRRRRRHSGSPGGLCPSDSDNWSGWVRGRHGPRPGILGLVNVPAWRGTRENAEVMTVAFHPYDRVFGRRDG
jgi:hypothetical protein